MGGGDLNLKKSWHPGTLKNQEKVWKLKQKLIDEKNKLEQLKKELQEEKDREELERLRTGKRKKEQDRLEWMYSQGISATSETIAQEKEDFLLGKKRIDSAGQETKLSHEEVLLSY
jgi:DNA-binding helix-hairpin-helix protein with protein kinase domain